MALPATGVWEVRTTGDDTNGGGYSSARGGTNYTLQDAAQLSLTDLACASDTTLTSATGGFTAAMVGNFVRINSGTNAAAGYYEITAYTNTNTVTIDRTCASGGNMTSGVGKVGGALASPGMAAGGMVAYNKMWVKAGTYSVTSTTQNVSGGKIVLSSSTSPMYMEGYQTTRGDKGTRPLLQASGIDTCILIAIGGRYCQIDNIAVDGAGLTSIRGISTESQYYNLFIRCHAANCTNSGVYVSANSLAVLCSATGCSTQPAILLAGGVLQSCEAYGNTVTGISVTGNTSAVVDCLSYDNTGASTYQFHTNASSSCFVRCTAFGDAGGIGGFVVANTGIFINCHADSNAAYGFVTGAGAPYARLINCSGYNNSSGNYNASHIAASQVTGFVAVTDGSPLTDPANHDFSLNSTALRGALLRAAGHPGVYPRGLTTGYADIGAVQHADPASGGAPWILEG